jgi:hypothetical protein
MRVKTPLAGRSGETLSVNKLLFPYNEEQLKYALYRMLEDLGIAAFLEPEVRMEKSKLKPDILVYKPYPHVWEVENPFKLNASELIRHTYDYEKNLGIRGFTFLWKVDWLTKGLDEQYGGKKVRDWVVQVNPINGELEGVNPLYEYGPEPPRDMKIEYALPGSPESHTRIQYELAVWLWGKGAMVSFEIPIHHEGKVYAPEELTIDEYKGIVDWRPFGWWSYAIDGVAPTVTVDVVSSLNGAITGYEVKSRRELRQAGLSQAKLDELCRRTLRELLGMVVSGLFNEAFIVLPREEAYAMAEEIEKSKSVEEKAIGVIALTAPYSFETVKEAEPKNLQKEHTLKIKVI